MLTTLLRRSLRCPHLWVNSLFILGSISCDERKTSQTADQESRPTTTGPAIKTKAKTETKAQAREAQVHLPWIKDDYTKAQAKAIKEKKPLVIDMWAEWCHTYLSMKNYVLNHPSLLALADRFIWLAVDTEKKKNVLLLAKYPPSVWPTFLLLGGDDLSVQARQLGASSVSKLRDFILQGERGHQDALAKDGSLSQDDPIFWMRLGDRAALAGKHGEAQKAFNTVLQKAPTDWKRRPEALLAIVSSLYKAEKWDACVDFGLSAMDQMGNGASAADLMALTYYCCKNLKTNDPRKKQLTKQGIPTLKLLCEDTAAPLSKDDRSEALRMLRVFLDDLRKNGTWRYQDESHTAWMYHNGVDERLVLALWMWQ